MGGVGVPLTTLSTCISHKLPADRGMPGNADQSSGLRDSYAFT